MKKEIIIDGNGSDWFEKATFVLKDSQTNKIPQDLKSYAEEIIENYMKKSPHNNVRALPKVDFTHQAMAAYEKTQTAYNDSVKKEYERINKEREILRKRARHVNTFMAISIIACILSLAALAFSTIG